MKGVVANDLGTAGMRKLGNRGKVGDRHYRIGRRFDKHHFGVRLKGVLKGGKVGAVDQVKFDAVVSQYAVEEPERAAVSVIAEQDVVAGLDELEHRIDRGHSGCEGKPEARILKRRDILF